MSIVEKVKLTTLRSRNLLPSSIRYGVAIVATITALAITVMLWSLVERTPFIFFFGAVAITAWRAGLGPAMLCAALAVVSLDFFLMEPRYEFFTSPIEILQFSIFGVLAFLISWLQSTRLQSEQELWELKEELEVILNTVVDGITAQDSHGQPIFANQAAAQLSALSSSQAVVNTPIQKLQEEYEIMDAAGRPISYSSLPRVEVFKTGKPSELTFRRRIKSTGKEQWINLKTSPVFDQKGDVRLVVNVMRDVTLEKSQQDIQARLAAIVENSDDAIISKDLDGTIVSWNRGAEHIYGYTPQEVVGKSISITYPPEILEREMQLLPRMRQGERIHHYETTRLTKGGERINISKTISPIVDNTGELVGYSTIERDITSLKKSQHEMLQLAKLLDKQRTRLKDVIANIPGIIWEAGNQEGGEIQRIDYLSDYAEKLLGYPADSWAENPDFWKEIILPEDFQPMIEELQKITLSSSGDGSHQFRCFTADGRILTLESHLSVKRDAEGKPKSAYGVIMDITERKKALEAMAQYAEELKRSNQELEQFAYIASHDLQEPLRMVASYMQLIEQRYKHQLDEDAQEFIDYAVDGATRMKNLISDLLTYSRVQRGREKIEHIAIQAVLDRVLTNLELSIEDTEAVITHDPLPELWGNEGQLIQLFQNLLSNAIKFAGDHPPQIHIGVEKRKKTWTFCVKDNGIGIDAEFLERIFVIFQRLHGKDEYSGTGIGLAICKKVVENHGGRIWVESTPGQGATFYFTLPIQEMRRQTTYGSN